MKINTRSGIEVVITGLTRNQLYLRVPWVRIPPTPPENSVCKRFLPFAGFFFLLHLWDFSVSSLLKIDSSLLNFLRFELWICSWRILSKAIRRRSYEITSNAPLRPFTIAVFVYPTLKLLVPSFKLCYRNSVRALSVNQRFRRYCQHRRLRLFQGSLQGQFPHAAFHCRSSFRFR